MFAERASEQKRQKHDTRPAYGRRKARKAYIKQDKYRSQNIGEPFNAVSVLKNQEECAGPKAQVHTGDGKQVRRAADAQLVLKRRIQITLVSDQQGNGNNDRADEGRKAKGLRRINLTELKEDDIEIQSDAEKIAVQMMEANGNSVDYSA